MKNIPTTELPLRVAALFNRKPTTPWSEREIRKFRTLVKSGAFKDPKDLEMIERYYVVERRKGSDGIYRRDLYTFLNNWSGELDRARALAKRQEGIRNKRKSNYPSEPESQHLTPEEIEKNVQFIKQQVESLRQRLRMPEAVRKELDEAPQIVREALEIFNGTLVIPKCQSTTSESPANTSQPT